MVAAAQTRTVPSVIVPVPLPGVNTGSGSAIAYYGPGLTQVDNNGNLLVFDTKYAYAELDLSNLRARYSPVVTTRISVVLSSGAVAATREYVGAFFQVVGVGRWGTYAILSTTAVRKLIAINAGVAGGSLPQTVAGFVSTDVADSVGQIDVVRASDASADTLYAVANSSLIALLTNPSTTSTRTIVTYKFAGGAFSSIKADLP